MNIGELIPPLQIWVVWAIQAALAVGIIALFAGLLTTLVAKIPVVGPVLAGIIRILAGNYEKWLAERLPKLAEQAVLAMEERYRKSANLPPEQRAREKLEGALELVQQMAPGLAPRIARANIESALSRIRKEGLEQKADLPVGTKKGGN